MCVTLGAAFSQVAAGTLKGGNGSDPAESSRAVQALANARARVLEIVRG